MDIVRKFIKSSNKIIGIEVNDITNVSYQNVKHIIPELINTDKYERAIYIILKSVNKYVPLFLLRFVSGKKKLLFLFWVQEQYTLINMLENQKLSSSPSFELVAAGINTLNVLGDINMIDNMAMGNVLEWKNVRALPYSTLFEKQLKTHLMDNVVEKLEVNRKNKR